MKMIKTLALAGALSAAGVVSADVVVVSSTDTGYSPIQDTENGLFIGQVEFEVTTAGVVTIDAFVPNDGSYSVFDSYIYIFDQSNTSSALGWNDDGSPGSDGSLLGTTDSYWTSPTPLSVGTYLVTIGEVGYSESAALLGYDAGNFFEDNTDACYFDGECLTEGHWQLTISGNVALPTEVPVPGALWLFGSALAGLGWARKKQK
jgi:hypothetical protein